MLNLIGYASGVLDVQDMSWLVSWITEQWWYVIRNIITIIGLFIIIISLWFVMQKILSIVSSFRRSLSNKKFYRKVKAMKNPGDRVRARYNKSWQMGELEDYIRNKQEQDWRNKWAN